MEEYTPALASFVISLIAYLRGKNEKTLLSNVAI